MKRVLSASACAVVAFVGGEIPCLYFGCSATSIKPRSSSVTVSVTEGEYASFLTNVAPLPYRASR